MTEKRALTNYHTHCHLCDGAGRVADYVTSAIDKGFSAIGFSSHAPLPFSADWVLPARSLLPYRDEVREAQRLYGDSIAVLFGMEIDYVEGICASDPGRFPEVELDYYIGSVHYVQTPGLPEPGTVDGPASELEKLISQGFGGDGRRLVTRYYENLRKMIDETAPPVIGHLDLVRKNNAGGRFFDESAPWYRDQVMQTLRLAAERDVIVEVNTGAMARGYAKTPYPEAWAIKECRNLGIRMQLNADAHRPDAIDFAFGDARSLMRQSGFVEQWIYIRGAWNAVAL